MPPLLPVQRDWGCCLHEAVSARRNALLLQRSVQHLRARRVCGESRLLPPQHPQCPARLPLPSLRGMSETVFDCFVLWFGCLRKCLPAWHWLAWYSLCRLASDSQSSACLCCPSAGIQSMYHHTQLSIHSYLCGNIAVAVFEAFRRIREIMLT